MASLHKDPRGKSRFWYAAFYGPDGRRKFKSTKATDRKLAMQIALEWEKAADAGRNNRLVESQVRRVLSEILEQATGSPLHFHTCRAWLDEWLAGKTGATSDRTFLKYSQVTKDFLEHLGSRADLPLNAISVADIRGFRDSLRKTGISPSTINQTVRKVLSTPFMAALRLGYIPVNPCAGVEALKDGADTEKDVFTPEQVAALCRCAEGDWKGVILAGYFTGLRLGDITELEWQAVDLAAGLLRVKTNKTGKTVVIPLAPELADWLGSQHPRGIGKAPVFKSIHGQRGTGRNGLSMQFKLLMEKAKIKGRILRTGKGQGRNTSSLSFHSLRHSFNSALANAGVSQELRQKLTGHASAKMNDRYTHTEVKTLRMAVAKLPSLKVV